ncbi:transposase [Cyanobacteria bacterium FACHB-502]|nr:transposase [Cyanobacteria bacterium FACHB-502]
MTFRPELLDELLKGYENPEDLLGDGGILKQLTAALVERCLNAEMKTHLEEQQAEPESEAKPTRNRRNGHSKKTIKGEFGEAQISVPRDRNSEFEPHPTPTLSQYGDPHPTDSCRSTRRSYCPSAESLNSALHNTFKLFRSTSLRISRDTKRKII